MKKQGLVLFVVMCLMALQTMAQHYYIPLNRDLYDRYDPWLYKVGSGFHSAIKPYVSEEIAAAAPIDSIDNPARPDTAFNKKWIGRKLRSEHLLEVHEDDFFLYGDINFELSGGKAMEDPESRNTYINSRGVSVGGTFGRHFSFASTYLESQARFPTYLDSAVRETFVVPGGARVKNMGDKFDYGTATGSISFSLKKHFSFQFGHDKNFIGDGYRSMLLSDNAYNYPFLKVNATFWKVKYMVLYALFQDGPYVTNDEESFRRKYATFHYLDVDIGKRLTVGVLEAIIWRYDSTRAFDINYMNPVIFLRPVEYSIGSPDNALIGFNMKFKLNSMSYLYGQLMLDEFKIDEVRARNGWWGNKQAFQLGVRTMQLAGIKGLGAWTEFNYARPYTYQHRSTATAYAHYNQPLAHPLGGNFWESISSVQYHWRDVYGEARFSYARVGYDYDSTGAPVNYGHNVLLSYETRPDEYGNKTLQGLDTKIIGISLRAWYLLNPKSNMMIGAGISVRNTSNKNGTDDLTQFNIGFRTALYNRYFDF
ncbi:MAG TPA: hypothetical protein VFW78_05695 [Bacteroidia bacterium]|nr:hypothetical protein [Bacteroidia bacterium]